MEPRALVASVFSVLGGAFILAGGLLLWLVGTVLAHLLRLSSPLFIVGVLVGVVAMAAGALLPFVARARRPLGAVIVACAVLSIPFAFGGFVLGFVLAAIGGTLALVRPAGGVWVRARGPTSGSPPWT
jgi:hypothetical protein